MSSRNGDLIRPSAIFVASIALLCGFLFSVLPASSQDELDPNKIWYRAFLLVQSSQELEAKGKYLEALNKLTEAKPLYDHLAQQFPDFQPEIVRERRYLIEEKRDELKTAMRRPQSVPSPVPSEGTPPAPLAPPRSLAVTPSEFPESSGSYGARSREMEVVESDS